MSLRVLLLSLLIVGAELRPLGHTPLRGQHEALKSHLRTLKNLEKDLGDDYVMDPNQPRPSSAFTFFDPFLDASYASDAPSFKYLSKPLDTGDMKEPGSVFSSTRSSILPTISAGSGSAASVTTAPSQLESQESSSDSLSSAAGNNKDKSDFMSSSAPLSNQKSSGSLTIAGSSGGGFGTMVGVAGGAYMGYHLWQRHRLFTEIKSRMTSPKPDYLLSLRGKTNEELLEIVSKLTPAPCPEEESKDTASPLDIEA